MNGGGAHIENRRQDMDKRLPHQRADEEADDEAYDEMGPEEDFAEHRGRGD